MCYHLVVSEPGVLDYKEILEFAQLFVKNQTR